MFLQISQQANEILTILQAIGLPTIIMFVATFYFNYTKTKLEVETHNKKIEKLEEEVTSLKTDIKEGIHEIQKTLLKMEMELQHLKERPSKE